MNGEIDLEKAQREEARWRILKGLDVGRPYPVGEGILLRLLADISLPISPAGLRRELGYLQGRDLVKLTQPPTGQWLAELTRIGIDLVEYTVDCDPGIARPARD